MIYQVYTQKFDGFCITYIHNARLINAPNEKEAIQIYKQNMKKDIGRKKVHIEEFNIPYGFIGNMSVDGKQYPSSAQYLP